MKLLLALLLAVFTMAELAGPAAAQGRNRSDPPADSRIDDFDDDDRDFYQRPSSPRNSPEDEEGSLTILWVLLVLATLGGAGWWGKDYFWDDLVDD
ncbi:MAG: hypothetical protein L0215_12220 [Gemmataceae bacterium]|nr:hypothetical protein [Gemmataceae bacterium]